MRILLIDPPFKRLAGLVNNYFPIGLGYPAAVQSNEPIEHAAAAW